MAQPRSGNDCVALVLDQSAEQHAIGKQPACIVNGGVALR
jgi:hypothetical protein